MIKIITKVAMVFVVLCGLLAIGDNVVLAQATCTLNGKEVPCEELGDAAKTFAGFGIALFVVGIVALTGGAKTIVNWFIIK